MQIADFGMSRDLQDEFYYKSSNKKIPVKWTAPEVNLIDLCIVTQELIIIHYTANIINYTVQVN